MQRKNATGAVFEKAVFLKVLSGFQSFAVEGGRGPNFKVFSRHHAIYINYCFPLNNVPH